MTTRKKYSVQDIEKMTKQIVADAKRDGAGPRADAYVEAYGLLLAKAKGE